MKHVITITLSFVNIMLAAYVMHYAYGLFIVPLGAPSISVPTAYGILLFMQAPVISTGVTAAVAANAASPKDDTKGITAAVAVTIAWLMMALFANIAARFA